MYSAHTESSSAWRGLAAGAVGGVVGSAAMLLFNRGLAAGSLSHYGFGAMVGALYGAAAAMTPKVTSGAGIPYGAAVFVAAGEIGIPGAGLSRKPSDYPPSRHAAALATHLVFGLTLEAVRRRLMRRTKAKPYDLTALGV